MKSSFKALGEGIGIAAICVLSFARCNDGGSRLVLIESGDDVRLLSAVSGSCPEGWNEGNFDDSRWNVTTLPFGSSSGACMRARFDPGSELARYRWLKIDLSARSQARLTSSKPLGAKQGLGSINWTTQDGDAAATAADADKEYTLDLELFPDLLQQQQNVLALQIASSARPVSVTAELDVDDSTADPLVHAVKGPYFVRPSAGAARVVWETSSSAPSWVVIDDQEYDGGWAVHHETAMTGLLPDSVHPVYVESAEANALPPSCAAAMVNNLYKMPSPETSALPNSFQQYILRRGLCQQLAAAIHSNPSQLRSAATSGAVHIVVVGDSRVTSASKGAILTTAATEAPDLIVHTGDLVSAASVEANWQVLFDRSQPLLSQAAIAPAAGEKDLAFGIDRFGQLFAATSDGALGHAYSVDQGAVHVAVLDSTADLAAQSAWLDADLTAATTAGARHLFVVVHWGPYSSGPAGGNAAAVDAIVPVALRHHVDALLSGHDNIYEHGVVGGLNYFVSGGAGDDMDQPRAGAGTIFASALPHYLLINVNGTTAEVLAKDAAGTILDDVTLQNP